MTLQEISYFIFLAYGDPLAFSTTYTCNYSVHG